MPARSNGIGLSMDAAASGLEQFGLRPQEPMITPELARASPPVRMPIPIQKPGTDSDRNNENPGNDRDTGHAPRSSPFRSVSQQCARRLREPHPNSAKPTADNSGIEGSGTTWNWVFVVIVAIPF